MKLPGGIPGVILVIAVIGAGAAVSSGIAQAGPIFTVTGGGSFIDRDNDFLWLTPRFGSGGQAVRIWQGGELSSASRG